MLPKWPGVQQVQNDQWNGQSLHSSCPECRDSNAPFCLSSLTEDIIKPQQGRVEATCVFPRTAPPRLPQSSTLQTFSPKMDTSVSQPPYLFRSPYSISSGGIKFLPMNLGGLGTCLQPLQQVVLWTPEDGVINGNVSAGILLLKLAGSS